MLIKIISNFINNNIHTMIGILWIIIRHRILVNYSMSEINHLLNVKIKFDIIHADSYDELELYVKKYYLYHLIQYGLEALIIMKLLKPYIISLEILGENTIWI